MFKIISGDFAKDSVYVNMSIMEMGKGFDSTTTRLKNAEVIKLLSDDEINNLIQNSDYALFVKDLKKAIKNDDTVCFYYKFKNGKEFTAIADLKTYQLVASSAKEEISEDLLVEKSSSKAVFIILISIIVIVIFCSLGGCTKKTDKNYKTQVEQEAKGNVKALSEREKLEKSRFDYQLVCEDKIKSQLNYPSTYKYLVTKSISETKSNINTYTIGFKAKNAYNLELEYRARCFVNSNGEITYFNIREVR